MSATMLEAYDTPMELQTDIDMNPSSSDMWFHDEAPMEDDGHPFYPQKLDAAHVDIEVDMESYDVQVTEYEMVDEAYQPGEELQDVEVYDASTTNSPAPAAGTELPEETVGIPAPKFLDSIHSDSKSLQNIALQLSAVQPPIETLIRSLDSSDLVLGGVPDPSVIERSTEEQRSMKEIHETVELVNLETSVLESTAPETLGDDKGETNLDQNHILATVPKNLQELSEEPVTESLLNGVVEKESDQVQPAQTGDSSAVSTGDPHEISEGVYIDPPPAVLLSVLSVEQDHLSLFNEPQIENLTHTEDDESPNVLLEHLPTLYYEPLASVFEALRQEECIAKLQDLADGELVLDAYDLELSIAEDNVYARELSLHDLNVLHDASGLSGPLRISLRVSVPRFIMRYHMLQDQASRLNLEQTTCNPREEERPVEQDIQATENQHEKDMSDDSQEQAEQNEIHKYDLEQDEQDKDTSDASQEPAEQNEIHKYDLEQDEQEKETSDISQEQAEQNEIHKYDLEQDEQETEPDDVLGGNESAQYEDIGPLNRQEAEDTLSETWLRQSDDAQASTYLETDPHEHPDATDDATDCTEIPDDGNQTNSGDHDHNTELYSDVHIRYSETDGENSGDTLDDSALHISSHDDRHALPSPRQAESSSPLEENLDLTTSKANGSGEESSSSVGVGQISEVAGIQTVDDSLEVSSNDKELSDAPPNNIDTEYPSPGEELAEDDWDYDLDGDGEPDTNWEAENEVENEVENGQDSPSNESSVTLSSKASKRSFDELERDNEDQDEDEEDAWPLNSSPQSLKRARVG